MEGWGQEITHDQTSLLVLDLRCVLIALPTFSGNFFLTTSFAFPLRSLTSLLNNPTTLLSSLILGSWFSTLLISPIALDIRPTFHDLFLTSVLSDYSIKLFSPFGLLRSQPHFCILSYCSHASSGPNEEVVLLALLFSPVDRPENVLFSRIHFAVITVSRSKTSVQIKRQLRKKVPELSHSY